jgi:hypothetical protein
LHCIDQLTCIRCQKKIYGFSTRLIIRLCLYERKELFLLMKIGSVNGKVLVKQGIFSKLAHTYDYFYKNIFF